MEPDVNNIELKQELAERFKSLPKPVQDAINSADMEAHLRTLANTHKLHLDQWEILENDVMLTLLGFQKPEDLERELKNDLSIDSETARMLAADISQVVFDPIRKELERELEHPEAQAKEVSGVEQIGAQTLAASSLPASAPAVAPAPIAAPAAPPETSAARAPISEDYKAGEASSVRKDVHSDPYREPPA